MKNVLFLLIWILLVHPIWSQPANNCSSADCLFGNMPSTGAVFLPGEEDDVLGCLQFGETQVHWYTFQAVSSGDFEMLIIPDNLGADIDFALYEGACPDDGGTLISCSWEGPISPGPYYTTGIADDPIESFGNLAEPVHINPRDEWEPTVTLMKGKQYYLVLDNITSNGVGFTILTKGNAIFTQPDSTQPFFTNPLELCLVDSSGNSILPYRLNDHLNDILINGVDTNYKINWYADSITAYQGGPDIDPIISQPGIYEYYYEIILSGGCNIISDAPLMVTVYDTVSLMASFSADQMGFTFQLENNSTGNYNTTYWQASNGWVSSEENAILPLNTTDSVEVCLTVENSCNEDTWCDVLALDSMNLCMPITTGDGETCQSPASLCSGGITGSTCGYAPDSPLVFCGGSATTENNAWYQVIADNDQISFSFTISSCTNDAGVQAVIYEAIQGNCNNLVEFGCFNSGGVAQDFTLTAQVTPGNVYLLMIDGYAGDCCGFELLASGTLQAPTDIQPPVIEGPGTICSGQATEFTIANPIPGAAYLWDSLEVLNTLAGKTVEVTAQQDVHLCVSVVTACGTSCSCRVIDVVPEPDSKPKDQTICVSEVNDSMVFTYVLDEHLQELFTDLDSGIVVRWFESLFAAEMGSPSIPGIITEPGSYTFYYDMLTYSGCRFLPDAQPLHLEFIYPQLNIATGENIYCGNSCIDLIEEVTIAENNGFDKASVNYYSDSISAVNGLNALIPPEACWDDGISPYWVRWESDAGCIQVEPVFIPFENNMPLNVQFEIERFGSNFLLSNQSIGVYDSIYWEASNGWTSTEENPAFPINFLGEVEICLYLENACTDEVFCQTVEINPDSIIIVKEDKDDLPPGPNSGMGGIVRAGDDLAKGSIQVFPNPTTNVLEIRSPEPIIRCVFYTRQGQILQEYALEGGHFNYTIETIDFVSGLYYLQVITATSINYFPIIIL